MKEHTCYALIMAPTLRTSAPLNQQPEVEAWLSEHTQALVALRAGTFTFVQSVYSGWHDGTAVPCLEMHMADTSILFFFAVKTTEVSFPLWCIRGGCKLSSSWAVTLLAVSFPSVSRLICIQDAALHPDMNHGATCILEKPIL